MGEFLVNTSKGKQCAADLAGYADKLAKFEEQVSQVAQNIQSSQQSMYQVKRTVQALASRVSEQQKKMVQLESCLSSCMAVYDASESEICDQNIVMKHIREAQNRAATLDLFDIFGIDMTDDGAEKIIEKLLKFFGKIGDDSETGLYGDVLAYLDNLFDFLIGGKNQGYDGAESWANLAKNSGNVWKSLYEYLAKRDVTGTLSQKFGSTASAVGILAAIFGMAGKGVKAFNTEGKFWGETVSDWGDVANGGIDIGKAIYAMKKTGGKGGGYFTLAQAITSVFGQAVESYSEYAADGEYSFADLNETAMDSSVSGLIQILKGVTFGIVDLDAEVVADTIKDFGRDWGDKAAQQIKNNPGMQEMYDKGGLERMGVLLWSIATAPFSG